MANHGPRVDLKLVKLAIQAYQAGQPMSEVTQIARCTKTTLYKHMKDMKIPNRDSDLPPLSEEEIAVAANEIKNSWLEDEKVGRWVGRYAK